MPWYSHLAYGQQQQFQQANERTIRYDDPCKSKTRTSAHEDQCDAYYECYDGQPVVQYCPNGLVYHGKSNRGLFGVCDYDFNVDCTTRPQRGKNHGSLIFFYDCILWNSHVVSYLSIKLYSFDGIALEQFLFNGFA